MQQVASRMRSEHFPLDALVLDLPWDARDATGQPLPPGVYTAETLGQHQRLILTR